MTYNEEEHIKLTTEVLQNLQRENLELKVMLEEDRVAALEREVDLVERENVELKLRLEDDVVGVILTRDELVKQLRLALHREEGTRETVAVLSARVRMLEKTLEWWKDRD